MFSYFFGLNIGVYDGGEGEGIRNSVRGLLNVIFEWRR